MCTLNLIEDEYHFMLAYPAYSQLRTNNFNIYYCHWELFHLTDEKERCSYSKSFREANKLKSLCSLNIAIDFGVYYIT